MDVNHWPWDDSPFPPESMLDTRTFNIRIVGEEVEIEFDGPNDRESLNLTFDQLENFVKKHREMLEGTKHEN